MANEPKNSEKDQNPDPNPG